MVSSPTKLKKKKRRVKLEPRSAPGRAVKKKKKTPCKTRPAHAYGCAVKKKKTTCKTRTAHAFGCAVKKPKVKHKPRTPTAARIKIYIRLKDHYLRDNSRVQ